MPTTIQLDPGIEKRLDFLADRTGRSKAFYLRQLIEEGIAGIEDYYLAADILESVRKGEEQTHSAAVVRKDLGLDD